MRILVVCTSLLLAPSAGFAADDPLTQTLPTTSPDLAVIAAEPAAPAQTIGPVPGEADKTGVAAPSQPAAPNATHVISRDEMCNTVAAAAQAHNLPVAFFTSLIWQESAFRPEVVSPVGAQGVAQFMPEVATSMGLADPFDPLQALPKSAQLLRTLFQQFGNFGLAAAAYNAGPRRIVDWLTKRGKLPKETRNYVLTITGQPAEQWRRVRADAREFRAPARTRCQIVASRPTRDASGDLHFREVANIPLPPRKPGTESGAEIRTVLAMAASAVPKRRSAPLMAAPDNVHVLSRIAHRTTISITVASTKPTPKIKLAAAR